jgi:hypothetical protein
MNCKPGDLAFVINDDKGCEQNIGRIVKVLGPAGRHSKYGDWSIEPTSGEFLIYQPRTKLVSRYADEKWSWIVFPDRDLRPIRPQGDDAADESRAWLPPVPTRTKEPA